MTETTSLIHVQEDTEQQFKDIAIRRIIWKLDRRLIPFFVLMEIISFLNRVSIGHVELMNIQTDLHMSQSEMNQVISFYSLALLISQMPSIFLMRFLGPTGYLSSSMIVWGGITVGMAFVTNGVQLLIIRCFLGITESGFFAGMIIYFSMWYCKRQQTMRFSFLVGAAIAAGAIDGIMAYGISRMEGIAHLHNWQWLYLLEGSPSIPLGIITFMFLSNIPDSVQWLDNCEKQLLTNQLREDAVIAEIEHAFNSRLWWRQVFRCFTDWRVYLYVMIAIGVLAVERCLITYLPLLVKSMGYQDKNIYLMTIPLYGVTFACCLLVSYLASRRNEHFFHLSISLFVSLIGFILMITLFEQGTLVIYVSLCIASCGIFAAYPILLSWLTNNIHGHTKRAMAIGFLVGAGNIGGIFSPQIYRDVDKPTYQRGHIICGGMVAAILIVTFVLRITLKLENRRRIHLSSDKRNSEAAIIEPCDWHPDVRYVL